MITTKLVIHLVAIRLLGDLPLQMPLPRLGDAAALVGLIIKNEDRPLDGH